MSLPVALMPSPEDTNLIRTQLQELRVEHRDLDDTIIRLGQASLSDELLLRRLKKRKLQLKDRISQIERLLQPDIPA